MRLLFFIHGMNGGGAERVMSILINNFAQKEEEIEIVYTSRAIESSRYRIDRRVNQKYIYDSYKYKSNSLFAKAYYRLWKYYAIRKETLQFNPDFVITFIRSNNNDVLAALQGTKYPIIVSDHTNMERKYPIKTSVLSKILYRRAFAITVLTKYDYNKLKDKRDNIFYIPNPCDLKQTLSNVHRRKVILAVGRVNQWKIKGFDNLIKAWFLIKDEFCEWDCIIIGDASKQSLDQLRLEVGDNLFNSVQFLGHKDNVYDYLKSSEIFCLSSRFEGMPMVLLEALSLGCACVAFDCKTGPREMIKDGLTGLLVKNEDYKELASKLKLLILDEELRNSFHNNSHLSIDEFSLENVMSLWYQMLNTCNTIK